MLSVAKDSLTQTQSDVYNNVNQAIMSNKLLMYQLNDILDFSAMQSNSFHYQFNKVSMGEIIDEIQSIYLDACQSKKITFSIKDPDNIKNQLINTDKIRILQILINLMNNSTKFTREEGQIQISLKKLNSNNIKIQVKDNGIGINKQKLDYIQQMLRNTGLEQLDFLKENEQINVGLGLRISARIVEGLVTEKKFNSLEIKSGGKGTKVSFIISDMKHIEKNLGMIPNKSQDENSSFDGEELMSNRIKSLDMIGQSIDEEIFYLKELDLKVPKISKLFFDKLDSGDNSQLFCSNCSNVLIVDDVPFNQMALKTMLIHHGISPDQAYDGFQAIEMVKQKSEKNHCRFYQLILMDIEMPGIDGFKTTKEIIKILSGQGLKSNIVMCSAYDSEENFEKAKQVGMADIMPKPVSKQNLERIISVYYKFDQ